MRVEPIMIGVDLAREGSDQTGFIFTGTGSITLVDAAAAIASTGLLLDWREVARILKRQGFTRTGHVGSGTERVPVYTRLRATRQQLDAAHPNRHLPKGTSHA
jgi:predicted RNA binding protein YcfA (HicA-like mRNA interferase family)